MSHRSRMCALLIDCPANHMASAVAFWSAALGRAVVEQTNPRSPYTRLITPEGPTLDVFLQALTSQEARVHFDIETDNVEAEVRRLESLGAHRRHQVESWWVMEAPSGHLFCVVPVQSQAWPAGAVEWPT
jgi:catechol 2,3-dioxygenase-like lactoylglutathione lyase family enzyme